MYKFQAKSTLHEINVVGTDFAGCVNPLRGRMFFVMKELRDRLDKIRKLGEEVVCIKHEDRGLIGEHFVSEFTILTDKDEHSCPNKDKCTKETYKLLDMANV